MTDDIMQYTKPLEFEKIRGYIEEYAVSPKAKEMALQLQPQTSPEDVELSLRSCEELLKKIYHDGNPTIYSVDNISDIAIRAKKGGTLSMPELIRIRFMLKNARNLLAWYSLNNETQKLCDNYFFCLYEDTRLENRIETSILNETEMADGASSNLASIRKSILRQEAAVRDILDKIIRSSSADKVLQDAVVTQRGGRFVVPVKNEYKSAVKGLVHDVSSSGNTFFIEPEAVVEANNKIMQLKAEEMKEIDRILAEFSAEIAEISSSLISSYKAFTEIDLLLAKARYAANYDGVVPKLNTDGIIDLRRARHPMIDKSIVVPIDIALGKDYDTLVITGPNTGGKTVTLKTVGLLTMMALSGIPIPCSEGSEISVFQHILVDIGDEQSIEQSLSTFSGHIRNLVNILRIADENSLVLVDELGAGTDPAEGAALAQAILERFQSLGAKTLATTHYGEIKLYALDTPRVQNASCEFDVNTLSPTYRVTVGIPGSSNALLIGERLGLDKDLLEAARNNVSAETRRLEDVLSSIEKIKSEAAVRNREAEQLLEEVKKKAEDAEKQRAAVERQAQRELDAVRNRARQMSADIQANADKLLKEIRELENSKDRNAAQRLKEISKRESNHIVDMAPDFRENDYSSLEPVEQVKPGDQVFVTGINQTATVLSVSPDGKQVEIKAGMIKSRTNIGNLRKPPRTDRSFSAKPQRERRQHPVEGRIFNPTDKRSGRNEISLIGMTTEEAIMELETFIDGALISHLNTIYIIHGKGTGALRKAVHEKLRTMKNVKSFRLGKYGEGEDGVTIAELK